MTKREDALPEDLITPEMVESFIAETNDLLDATETDLLELEKNPNNLNSINEAFRYVHTVKGNSGFFGYADIESQCMDIESLMDGIRKGNKHPDHKFISVLLGKIDSVRDSLRKLKNSDKNGPELAETRPESSVPDTPETAKKTQAGEKEGKVPSLAATIPEENTGKKESEKPERETAAYKSLGDLLVEMGAATEEVIEEALEIQQRKLGEILVEEGAATPGVIEKALRAQSADKSVPAKGTEGQELLHGIKRKDIRVDMTKLDKLFDLMGELMTAEAMVVAHPELEGKELPNFQRASAAMSKITRAMQEITMTIRMIPLDGLFNKMRRLVRDLAKKFDKVIDLTISGQETEMDRNVIEEISDPLVHIIRNSIDHGIEGAALRKELSKPEAGKISLDAKYEGNEIWITISDDGGGLKKAKILEKAAAGGLISGTGEDLPDEQVWKLIFEPGFSTADKVSEISGRGVGMDVVKRNIDKLRGKIAVQSEQEMGTTIILKIPLTLAIIDGILFKVGEMMYALPLGDIVEFQKVKAGQVTKTGKGNEVLNLRSEIIPVIKVFGYYGIETKCTEVPAGIVILVHAAGLKAALLVDEIVGYRQLVIKPLPDILKSLRAVSGCSIMGNGDVSLIIDTGGFLRENLG